jgi:hypothetical protein
MTKTMKYRLTLIAAAVTYIAMVTVNALANILPINGRNTGAISDFYENLFAPIGFTFSIWGLIYLLLAGFTLFQLMKWNLEEGEEQDFIYKVSGLFTLSSIANLVWIFAWHYDWIPLSLAMMVIILITLIYINVETHKRHLSEKEKWFVRLPFSVYFGWISVATIANVTTLLVYWDWDGFSIPYYLWTDIVLIVGVVIAITVILSQKDMAYGFVIIWAYIGILAKHISQDFYAGEYISIIVTVIVGLLCLTVAEMLVFKIRNRKPETE